MHAVIALCHFCENHGPRVVVTCQPIRALPTSPTSQANNVDAASSMSRPESSVFLPNVSPAVSPEPNPFYGDCTNQVIDDDARCNACTSFSDGPCLLSNDNHTHTSYVTSQVALKERVHERVKYACLRSLSCEISAPQTTAGSVTSSAARLAATIGVPGAPGHVGTAPHNIRCTCADNMHNHSHSEEHMNMEGTDDSDGHVFFGDSDHGYTLSLTFRLQDSKARGFLRLFSLIIVSADMTYILNNHDFFLQALTTIKTRLQVLASRVYKRETSAAAARVDDAMRPENASRASRMPAGWFRQRGGRGFGGGGLGGFGGGAAGSSSSHIHVDPSRSLETVTGDDKVFHMLHKQMMWTLRTQSLRCSEDMMEGVPSQDMLVMMEMPSETILSLDLDTPDQHNLTLKQLDNLKYMALQLHARDPADLDLLIAQIVLGGQVVAVGCEQEMCKQVLLSLSNLLPIGCLRMTAYADTYEHVYKSNLLGGPESLDIPLNAEDPLVLRVRREEEGTEGRAGCCSDDSRVPDENTLIDMEDDDDLLDAASLSRLAHLSLAGCRVEVLRRPARHLPRPTLLNRFRQLLLDDDVVSSVLDATVRSTREQWMGKAKLAYQLTRQATPLPIDRILAIVKARPDDKEVLQFWQAGLSKSYKQRVLATLQAHTPQ